METVLPISYQRDVVLRKKVSTAFRALDGSYADEVPVDKLRRRFLVAVQTNRHFCAHVFTFLHYKLQMGKPVGEQSHACTCCCCWGNAHQVACVYRLGASSVVVRPALIQWP